ncbi:MAG: glycosyltransferase [Acidobacteria bacterium]|nr:glycosyltransferase [Acidobacteriota bacterium]MYG74496.1 glycosyltransferase [Acidobacteriota bacterium]
MTCTAPSRRLSVFTRVPEPGRAKTRLVPPLTADQAAALQRAMTEDLLERLDRTFGAAAAEAPPLSLEVRCDGRFSPGALEVPKSWATTSQGSGDLGERLARATRGARRDGIGRLVIIGSDAPLLPLPLVGAAFSGLADRDALVAPAEDGGYVLIGLALERVPPAAVDPLFAGIPWGTGAVREATAEAARRAGLGFGELAGHWDVDRPEDLPRLAASIRALDAAARPRRTGGVLTALGF